jgi:hypothetical protein
MSGLVKYYINVIVVVITFGVIEATFAQVYIDEQFNSDVIQSGAWIPSDTSVKVDVSNGWLRVGSDGVVDGYVEKQGTFPLPLVIEWRERTYDGDPGPGPYFSLPKLEFWWGISASEIYKITYVDIDNTGLGGWLMGNPWTNVLTLGPTNWDQWRTIRAIIRSDGGELFVKKDGDIDFTSIITTTWSIPNEIQRIRFSQHTDDISDLDHLRVDAYEPTNGNDCWSALGQGLNFNGANLTTYQGKLVAMGPFSEAGGVSTGGIATWDGTVWGSIGTGLYGQINNALEHNGKLYAVGNSNGVYVWDGSTWSTIPTDGWTQAITIYDGRLIVGGRFTMIDGVSASRVAAFDGSTWTSLGAGAVGGSPVTQLLNATVYNGKLYVGGIFDQMDGVSAKNVAVWDGTQWNSVGNGIDEEVGSFVEYEGKLIIGGYFNNFDTLTNVGHLVAWDGQNATRLGTGTQGVNGIALTVFDGRLVVTGAFASAGGISANGVAFWDGEDWEALGSGVSGGFGGGAVVWEDNLYITGDFTEAGGKSASRIASWNCRKPVPDSGSISGTISSNSEPLLGVSVSLINDLGSVVEEVQSNESGYYSFVSVVNGSYTVSVLAPLGYNVAQEAIEAVVNGNEVVVNFVCSIQVNTPAPKSRAWWAHQAHLALNGKASLLSTHLFGTFGDQILAHFTENQLNPVTIYETSKFEAAATKLQAIKGLLSLVPVKGDEPFIRRLGRAQLMALMLNVVSGKIHQKAMVTKDSVNVSQVITYCDLLLNDLLPMPEDNGPGCGSELGRYIRADFILTLVNLGVPVPAGLVPVSTLDIAYKQTGSTIPEVFALHQNYPNPFNPETVIEFDLPESEAVILEVINVLGQTVATLVHEELPAGSHRETWDGRSGGREVSSGVYFYRLVTNSRVESRKMILLR